MQNFHNDWNIFVSLNSIDYNNRVLIGQSQKYSSKLINVTELSDKLFYFLTFYLTYFYFSQEEVHYCLFLVSLLTIFAKSEFLDSLPGFSQNLLGLIVILNLNMI